MGCAPSASCNSGIENVSDAARGIDWMVIDPQHDADQPQQRQHAAGEREQEKLIGRVAPLFVPPNADQEVQRNQREFEEDVEQNDVAGGKHAQACRFPSSSSSA